MLMKKLIISIAILFSIISNVYSESTSVPSLINYQGTLTNEEGILESGTKTIEFNIYDAEINGNLIWGPQIFSNVRVINGQFNIILGSTDTQGRSIANAFSSSNRYIGIKVDDKSELKPLQKVLSVPYALNALNSVPIASIIPYFGSKEPEGWLFCDGRALDDVSLNKKKYNRLKVHLKEEGFNKLPDFRGNFPLGNDNMNNKKANRVTDENAAKLGTNSGLEKVKLTNNEIPQHQHGYKDIFYSEDSRCFGGEKVAVPGKHGSHGGCDRDNVGWQMNRTSNATGGNQAHNNMPPYITINYIIKY